MLQVNSAGGMQSAQLEFMFRDVNVYINGTQILHNISGIVNSGEVLALMGPSGSGKSTLLNSLAGRTGITSGEITLDKQLVTKRARKRMCYVMQQDIFLSKLTLWETLYFAAMVYLPERLSLSEKLAKIDDIIDVLDLNKCRNTVVGNQIVAGLSGGEKKRLSIACELIKDPEVIIMDEPTSGLDSSTAYSLMLLMERYTKQSGKAVVVSIHQPSSQVFHLFTHLLLLANGHVAYFGDGRKALSFFEELDLICEPHFNPADFILEMLKKDKDTLLKIIDLAEEKRSTDLWPARLRHSGERKLSHLPCLGPDASAINLQVRCGSVTLYTDSIGDVIMSLTEPETEKIIGDEVAIIDGPGFAKSAPLLTKLALDSSERWETGFWMQFKVLNWRNFKQSRSRIISKYNIINSMLIAVICSLMWFKVDRTHETIKTRMGYFFFMTVYWSFYSMFDTITSFPEERPVVLKERAASAYRLSAYYFAKMSSELPLMLVLPTAFCTLTYWMAGMRGVSQFFATWAILLLQVLNCQGLAYVAGAAIWDLQLCITTISILVIFGLLSAGFYVDRLPAWLSWSCYLSVVYYPYNAMCILELDDLTPLQCINMTTSFDLPICRDGENTTVVSADAILDHYNIDLPLYFYVLITALQLFFWRSLAYIALKYKNKLH